MSAMVTAVKVPHSVGPIKKLYRDTIGYHPMDPLLN